MLSEEDEAFLNRKKWPWDAAEVVVGNAKETHVIIHGIQLPERYQPRVVDLLIRIPSGYPEVRLDMFWTRPDVVEVATGRKPHLADVPETYNGVQWQRWSRHNNHWRPSIDNLETFFATVTKEFD